MMKLVRKAVKVLKGLFIKNNEAEVVDSEFKNAMEDHLEEFNRQYDKIKELIEIRANNRKACSEIFKSLKRDLLLSNTDLELEFVDSIGEEHDGVVAGGYSMQENKIYLIDRIEKKEMLRTLIHEMIHALQYKVDKNATMISAIYAGMDTNSYDDSVIERHANKWGDTIVDSIYDIYEDYGIEVIDSAFGLIDAISIINDFRLYLNYRASRAEKEMTRVLSTKIKRGA